MLDPRTRLMLKMCASEERMLRELANEQVSHPSLADYQPGAAHYERLMAAVEQNQRFTLPNSMEPNL